MLIRFNVKNFLSFSANAEGRSEEFSMIAGKVRSKKEHVYDNGKIKENGQNGDALIDNKSCIERMLYHDVVDTSAWAKLYHKTLFNTVKYPKGKIFEDIGTTYALMLQCENIGLGYESKYNYIFHNNSIVNSTF